LPIGIIIGIFIVIAIYLLANITYLSLLPVTELEHMYKTQNSIAAIEAVRTFGNEWRDLHFGVDCRYYARFRARYHSHQLSHLFCNGEGRTVFRTGGKA
jgi:hypothetical protein